MAFMGPSEHLTYRHFTQLTYGNRSYGSGYPGVPSTARGTSGYGFPFFYYPIVFVPIGGYGGYHYVNHEVCSSSLMSLPSSHVF